MEYTVENLSKGHKKEDLIKIILGMQADHKEDREMLVSQVDCQQKYIKELQSDLKNRDSEYQRWKEYNKDFLTKFIDEYMASERETIVEAAKKEAVTDIVNNLSIDDSTDGDYYSSWTNVTLKYKDNRISSCSVYSL